jgi:hypothetical protein
MIDHDAFNQGFFEIGRLVNLGNDAEGRRRHKWAVVLSSPNYDNARNLLLPTRDPSRPAIRRRKRMREE